MGNICYNKNKPLTNDRTSNVHIQNEIDSSGKKNISDPNDNQSTRCSEIIYGKSNNNDLVDQDNLQSTESVKAIKKIPKFSKWSELETTPMIDISSVTKNKNVTILGKCEFMNPTGSIKDRSAKHMLNRAEEKGELKKGMTIVVASSGNTASAVAMWAKMRKYKSLIITNTKCSQEKIDTVKAYGGEVMITADVPADSPDNFMNIEKRLVQEIPGQYYSMNQFGNLDNPQTYEQTLGPEIWKQVEGNIDYFVAGAGTGGTLTGTSKFLKQKNPELKSIQANTEGSMYGQWCRLGYIIEPSKTLVEGVSLPFIPKCLDRNLVDDFIDVTDDHSFNMCHELAQREGVLVGGSSGTNVHACKVLADSLPDDGKKYIIVTILVDSGVKYLTKVFNEKYLIQNDLHIRNSLLIY